MFQSSPDEAFDQMLQGLESDIEMVNPEDQMSSMFHNNTASEDHADMTNESGILSLEANALLQCFPELVSPNTTEYWWTCPPSCQPSSVSGDSMVSGFPHSPSLPLPVPPAPSPSNPSTGPLRDPSLYYLPQFPEPILSLNGDHLPTIPGIKQLGSRSSARPRPNVQQTDAFTRHSSVSRNQNQSFKQFEFVLEDIGGQAPVFIQ